DAVPLRHDPPCASSCSYSVYPAGCHTTRGGDWLPGFWDSRFELAAIANTSTASKNRDGFYGWSNVQQKTFSETETTLPKPSAGACKSLEINRCRTWHDVS